jgi:hypothetical protein
MIEPGFVVESIEPLRRKLRLGRPKARICLRVLRDLQIVAHRVTFDRYRGVGAQSRMIEFLAGEAFGVVTENAARWCVGQQLQSEDGDFRLLIDAELRRRLSLMQDKDWRNAR